ncbi:MAG: hypothetical protein ACMG6S_03585 [Byssovorax sp.]
MRILDLTRDFYRTRRVYAPHGSVEDNAVRRVLIQLASERHGLPLAGDEEDLRTPFKTIWAHRISDAALVVTYSFALPVVEVRVVRPAWRTGG